MASAGSRRPSHPDCLSLSTAELPLDDVVTGKGFPGPGLERSFAHVSNASCVTLPSNASVFSQDGGNPHFRNRTNSGGTASLAASFLPGDAPPLSSIAERRGRMRSIIVDDASAELAELEPITSKDDLSCSGRGDGTPVNSTTSNTHHPNNERAASRQSRGFRGGSSRNTDPTNRYATQTPCLVPLRDAHTMVADVVEKRMLQVQQQGAHLKGAVPLPSASAASTPRNNNITMDALTTNGDDGSMLHHWTFQVASTMVISAVLLSLVRQSCR